MRKLHPISIFEMHDDDPSEFNWVQAWISRWKLLVKLRIANYSTDSCAHYWDIETCAEVVAEVPEDCMCASECASPELFNKKLTW